MAIEALKFLSEVKLSELRAQVPANRDRYSSGDFVELERENGWAIETTSVEIDLDALNALDGTARTAEADITNSLIVYRALYGITPALAREERVWARLTHVEGLAYSRARWLTGRSEEQLDAAVRLHMFASGRTGVRDDNALSRLWWNMHIASIADPHDPEDALKLILKTADIRSSFVERIGMASRRPLAQAVIRAMRVHPGITATERTFRDFMIALNRDGSGVLFEALSVTEADSLLAKCAENARVLQSQAV